MVVGNEGNRSRQRRAHLTREQLIDAARDTFARDGFDLARLEEIATAAGKTRGAFYAHFRDKEDVFFAIFEEDLARDKARIRDRLQNTTSRSERVEVLALHLAELLHDRRRMLLNLEFKMYTVRHPQKQKRLADLHTAMCLHHSEIDFERLLPELSSKEPERQRTQAAQLASLIDGLALNTLFDPRAIGEQELARYLRANLNAILDASPAPVVSLER